MGSKKTEEIGLRRSTRISALRSKQVPMEEQSAGSKRKASVKKTGKMKDKQYLHDEELAGSDSDEEQMSDKARSSSESDEFVPQEKKQRKGSSSRKLMRAKKSEIVQPRNKSSSDNPMSLPFGSSWDSATPEVPRFVNRIGISKTSNDWNSLDRNDKDKEGKGFLDDSEFLLNKDISFPIQPTTSKMPTLSSGVPKRSKKFSSESEDENEDWEEMVPINTAVDSQNGIEIHLKRPVTAAEKQEENEAEKWEKMIRLEIARKRRELVENCHKFHFLCYVAHLRFFAKTVVEGQSELVDVLSKILPPEVSVLSSTLMEKAVDMFRSAFKKCENEEMDLNIIANCSSYIQHLKKLIVSRSFTNDRDLSVIFFALCHCVFKLTVRLCVAFNPMPKCEVDDKSKVEKKPPEKKIKPKSEPPRNKSLRSDGKSPNAINETSDDDKDSESSNESTPKKPLKRNSKKKYNRKPSTNRAPANVSGSSKIFRNYWIEYFNESEQRWICVDPYFKMVDSPKEIEKLATKPILYIIGFDNEMGAREISSKYASEFLISKFRKLRMDDDWLNKLFHNKLLRCDMSRTMKEDAEIRDYLRSLPMPTVISEFKNHPLYALEKDLLKFEAIYPRDTESLGTIRGHKIFPRNSVHHLQGELNWIKLARTVKEGEEPYKTVKARPKITVPKEQRVPLSLQVFGYWQTTKYVPPEVVDGVIPRNEFGNIYMYQDCMLPKRCRHLRLAGIHSIARKLDLEAVPAIVGWEFSGGGNHPVVDGCVVLEKDAQVLYNAWHEFTQLKAEKDAKRTEERIWKNWKRLIKGKLMLENMRVKFHVSSSGR